MWNEFLVKPVKFGYRYDSCDSDSLGKKETVFNEPELDGAVRITKNTQNHDGCEALVRV